LIESNFKIEAANVGNEITLIAAIFCVDWINIYKVTSCKTNWYNFFGSPCTPTFLHFRLIFVSFLRPRVACFKAGHLLRLRIPSAVQIILVYSFRIQTQCAIINVKFREVIFTRLEESVCQSKSKLFALAENVNERQLSLPHRRKLTKKSWT